jgi:tetratricopeptide (TPR) repeat protein
MRAMKFSIFTRVLFLIALAATWCHGQINPAVLGELRQLPEIVLDRKSEWDAKFQSLKADDAEQRRYGFAFKTPSLVDGPATLLVVWDVEFPAADAWQVTKPDGSVLTVVSPETVELSAYPDLAAKYPKGKSVQRVRVPNHQLVKATRYQATLTTDAKNTLLGISINVALRGVGVRPGSEVLEMKIPQQPISSEMVMELVENIRHFRGDAAAITFLEAQFAEKAKQGSGFSTLFYAVWNEAQFGAGKEDAVWASRLNDAAFISAYKIGHYGMAFEIMNNLCACLSNGSRYGRLAEVHAILEDAYRKGGQNMDPATFPDKGPALPSLPIIRHREITMATPYSKEFPAGPSPLSRVSSFNDSQAGALKNYSGQRMNRGDWRGALEWAVWLQDWSTDKEGNLIQARNSTWYSATFDIALHLNSMGYTDEALAVMDAAVAAPFGRDYRGRDKIMAERMQLDLQRQAGRPDPEIIPKFRALITQIENHVHFGKSSVWATKINLAQALIHLGQHEEGDRIIAEVIAEGSEGARWTRLDRWLETGKTEGVEAELIYLLKQTRESGHKISELWLYSRYSDFLETTGRLQEALAMRQEAVRLARDFNAFTSLPQQLAKLAILLQKLGYADLATKAADEARALMKDGHMPAFTIKTVNKSLAELSAAAPARPQQPIAQQPAIDLQPHRGLVIPLEDAAWTSYLTLTNPGTASVRGTLEISGAALTLKEEKESGDIAVELMAAQTAPSSLALTLAPGSYRLITIAADAKHAGEGELAIFWRTAGAEKEAKALILIDKREEGVAGAIIQAGDYQANPFYGVPIHLSYVAKDKRAKSSPLRFKASQDTRIEIYQLDGTPIAVDGSGNGTLLDRGDELFGETDGAGHVLANLTDGVAPLKIIAYPRGQIATDGLKIDIEVLDEGVWNLHSQNKIEP